MKARAKNIIVAGVSIAAFFGIASVAVLVINPEGVSQFTKKLTAKAKSVNTYSLPATLDLEQEFDKEKSHSEESNKDKEFFKSFVRVMKNLIPNIANKSKPALVFITAEKKVNVPQFNLSEEFFFPFLPPQFNGSPNRNNRRQSVETDGGSGFIVDLKNGYIITNSHVIDGADKITVTTADNVKYQAKILGSEKKVDIAVLKLENFKPSHSLKQVSLDDSNEVKVGEFVLALGAPFELPQTLTFGVVSALQRNSDVLGMESANSFIQTDAAINPGNSGGPLVNIDGRVIGMNTAIYSRNGTSVGIGFAIPSNTIRLVAESIINYGKLTQAYLGVRMLNLKNLDEAVLKELKLDPKVEGNTDGVLVVNVEPKSPASSAGLKPYDIIIGINKSPVKTAQDLQRQIIFIKPGSEVTVHIKRNGKKLEVKTVLVEPPENNDYRSSNDLDGKGGNATKESLSLSYGMTLTEKKLNNGKKVVIISNVQKGSIADRVKLSVGDTILTVDQKEVSSVMQVEKILRDRKESKSKVILLVVKNKGVERAVILQLNS